MVVKIILIILFIYNIKLFSEHFNMEYPLSINSRVSLIDLKEFNFKTGKQSYISNYKNFFVNCKTEKSYLYPYKREVYCDKTINTEKLKFYRLLYGDNLLNRLKKIDKFYINYYNNITKYDNKLFTSFKNKFEVFIDSRKEILFYSRISFNTSKIYKLNYSNLLPLYLNIIIYLFHNSLKFNFADIKIISSYTNLSDPIAQKYYEFLKHKRSYVVSSYYNFRKDNFNVKRYITFIVDIKTRTIIFYFIRDIGIKLNIEK